MPCLLRVTMPGGEGRIVVGEEKEEELGWQGTGLHEAGLVEVKDEGRRGVGSAAGPKI